MKENVETKIDRWVNEIKNTRESSKKFKPIKMLNRHEASNSIVPGKDGKSLLNTQDIHKEIKRQFELLFWNKSYQTIDTFNREERPFNLIVSLEESESDIKKLNNNRAPRLDEIATELVKYVPVELKKVIKSVLNECFEGHEDMEVVKSAHFSIKNLVKPRGSLKNLLRVILLQIIRKIPSNVAIRQIKIDTKSIFLQFEAPTYKFIAILTSCVHTDG